MKKTYIQTKKYIHDEIHVISVETKTVKLDSIAFQITFIVVEMYLPENQNMSSMQLCSVHYVDRMYFYSTYIKTFLGEKVLMLKYIPNNLLKTTKFKQKLNPYHIKTDVV